MTKKLGRRGYSSESIEFIVTDSLKDNYNFSTRFERKLVKSILLATYDTPSTAEDLSFELGIDLLYINDELEFLTKINLIHKIDNKYNANLIITSALAQKKIRAHEKLIIPKLTKAIIDLIEYENKCTAKGYFIQKQNLANSGSSKLDILIRATDLINSQASDLYNKKFHEGTSTNLPYNCELNIIGLEKYSESTYNPSQYNTAQSKPLSEINHNIKRIICIEEPQQKRDYLIRTAIALELEHYAFCIDVVSNEAPVFLNSNKHLLFNTSKTIFNMQGLIIKEAISIGYFSPSSNNN